MGHAPDGGRRPKMENGMDYFLQETVDEVEIHEGEFDEEEIDGNISKSGKWNKTGILSLSDAKPLTKSDEIVHAVESSMFELFFCFYFQMI